MCLPVVLRAVGYHWYTSGTIGYHWYTSGTVGIHLASIGPFLHNREAQFCAVFEHKQNSSSQKLGQHETSKIFPSCSINYSVHSTVLGTIPQADRRLRGTK